MKDAVILSTGSHLPEKVVANQDLVQFPETVNRLITPKTGVVTRRHAQEDECTSDLAFEAARRCLEKVDFPAGLIQGIIVSTSSPDRMQPATSVRVQHRLGAVNAFAFDINSVCSGSVFGICLTDCLIRSGRFENILFIASEMYSKILNENDFSTYPFFGDGAGAILFHADSGGRGVLHSCLRTDGSGSEKVRVQGGGTMLPFARISNPEKACFKMDGKAVFAFAVEKVPLVIIDLLTEAGVQMADIRCFISHQANINIIHKIAEKIGASPEKFFTNIERYGNTASASVAIALDEALEAGVIGPGDLIVTVAFGGGLSWGANLIRL